MLHSRRAKGTGHGTAGWTAKQETRLRCQQAAGGRRGALDRSEQQNLLEGEDRWKPTHVRATGNTEHAGTEVLPQGPSTPRQIKFIHASGKSRSNKGKKKKKKVDLELILCKKLMTNIVSKNIPHKKQPGLCEETADSKAGAYKLTDEHRPSCYA